MNRNLRILAAALPLLLVACAPVVRMKGDAGLLNDQAMREQALAHADHWTLQGRLGVSDGKSGGDSDDDRPTLKRRPDDFR